jgi:hypothetical protein
MPTTQTEPRVTFQIAEEGEAIGTVQQFASRMNLSQPRVLSCLDQTDTASVVLPAGDEEGRLLIVDADGLEALLHCAPEKTPS